MTKYGILFSRNGRKMTFHKCFCQGLLSLLDCGRLILKHPQTKPFQGALPRLGLIKFIDKPVPALGIWKWHTQMQDFFHKNSMIWQRFAFIWAFYQVLQSNQMIFFKKCLVIGNQNNVWTHNVIQFWKGSLKKRLKIDGVSHVENLFLQIFGIFD